MQNVLKKSEEHFSPLKDVILSRKTYFYRFGGPWQMKILIYCS